MPKFVIKDRWRTLWQSRRNDVRALSVVALLFVSFFLPLFCASKFFVINDAFVYSYPLRTVAWQTLRHGALPLWTTLILAGYPMLSMAQIGWAYPLTWGYLFLPGYWAEEIFVLAPFILFPAFSYAYVREIGRSHTASLLAALTFGYSGAMVSALSCIGLHTNALMWLPLVLIAIERSQRSRFVNCLLGATAAYSMSVLTGYAQGFVIAGLLTLVYGLFKVLAARTLGEEKQDRRFSLRSWERWKPLVVVVVAIAISGGLAAFQILETLSAQRCSIRSSLTYDSFTSQSLSPRGAVASFLAPLHHVVDTTAYVAPLSFILVLSGLGLLLRKRFRDPRLLFWAAVALVAFVLMFGKYNPLYRLIYHLPVLNLFRAPARHAFELAFALGVLTAYGWDAAEQHFRQTHRNGQSPQRRHTTSAVLILLALALAVGLLWRFDLGRVALTVQERFYGPAPYPERRYLLWKVLFSSLTVLLTWCIWRIGSHAWRSWLQLCVIALACLVEPALFASRFWWPGAKSASRFTTVSEVSRYLKAYPPEQNRIYTRTSLWWEEYATNPRLEPANLSMLQGLHNVAGYEPLILDRYSRALGNAFLDGVTTRPGYPVDKSLLESQSHVLDILNTSFVVSYSDLSIEPNRRIDKEGIKFRAQNPDLTIEPGETTTLPRVAADSDSLSLVTTLSNSADLPDGTVVAKVRLFTTTGRIIEREILAGRDTAEWAHERPDVISQIRHRLAPIFDSHSTDYNGTDFPYYRYWTTLKFGERLRVEHIEIVNISKQASLTLWKATLYDSATRFSMPLPHYDLSKWQPVYDQDDVIILRNKNALPRLWLVAKAEAVDGEEALRRIRGASEHPFDPRTTALLEIRPENLPALPAGPISANATARLVSYEDNRLVVDTAADSATVLVLSEINYPGWVATVDGRKAPIHATDFLLRGVVLSAGSHRVEMRYTAPAARNGAIISVFSLLLISGIAVYFGHLF